MSIERLVVCACGHSVNVHDASGCGTLLKNGQDFAMCACSLTRAVALDRLIEAVAVPPETTWLDFRRRTGE